MIINGISYPSVKLTYGRIVLYSEARRTFEDNLAAARQALSILLDVSLDGLDDYIAEHKEWHGEPVVDAYRSY